MSTSEAKYKMISDIFRIACREVDSNNITDTSLYNGEVGIDWNEGTFYGRNPHTGQIITPNSMAHLNTILSKFNVDTGALNADYVSGLRFYTNIDQIPSINGITMTVDAYIANMETPSILISEINMGSDFTIAELPAPVGVLEIRKISNNVVDATFVDTNNTVSYLGKYDTVGHLFLGWIESNIYNKTYTVTEGDGATVTCTTSTPIEDLAIISLRTTFDVVPDATLSANDGEPYPILCTPDTVRTESIPENRIVTLIKDDVSKTWLLVTDTENAVTESLQRANSRLTGITSALDAALATKGSPYVFTATIPTTGWTTDTAGYHIDIGITGITAAMTPTVDVVQSADVATALLQLEAYSYISRMVTSANSVTVYCYAAKPTTEIPIQLVGVV